MSIGMLLCKLPNMYHYMYYSRFQNSQYNKFLYN